MAAPKTIFKEGNKVAEKWTFDTVMPILESILENIDSYVWIGDALIANELYKDIWAYWTKTFKDNEVVFRTIKRIECIFEGKLFKKALTGNYVPAVAIFGLKNNYGWTDKTTTDITTNGKDIQIVTIFEIPNDKRND